MNTVVFVHGRGQSGKGSDTLHRSWRKALALGLKHSPGHSAAKAPDQTRMAYYADLLAPPTTLGPSVKTFAKTWMAEIDRAKGWKLSAVASNVGNAVSKANPAASERFQAFVKRFEGKAGWSQDAFGLLFRDVDWYLTDTTTRRNVNNVVRQAILASTDVGPCVVVGHSLGSVVAYNVLRSLPATTPVRALVTLGSPLATSSILNGLTPKASGVPACVAQWLNAYDERDIVALEPLRASVVDPASTIDEWDDLDNDSRNHHAIERYLAVPEVARWIADAFRSNAGLTPSSP
jgi:pimeloyl-ACP methyl ester carboxylesterase